MIRSPIQVFVRTRPVAEFAHEAIRIEPDECTVNIHLDRLAGSVIGLNNLQQDWSFKFAKVLHNESQDAVFDACARDMVESTLNGYNGTLMAYGQTGAGKTFTMGNPTFDYKHRGITPRAISLLFHSLAARTGEGGAKTTVQVSYLEIYNETLRDLLLNGDTEASDLSLREDASGRVSVKGLTKPAITTEEHALNLLFEGDANRAMGQHAHNRASSRSHAIFTIHVERECQVDGGSQVVRSKLNLVDLAGSERVAKTDSRGQTLQEALYINRSLSFLEQVVIALSDKNRDHIPYRSSKLTHVLRDSLGGNSIMRMIANIWPEAQHLDETISTLKFATRMMRLTTNASVNAEPDAQLLIKNYEREIVQLKRRLAKLDMNIDHASTPSASSVLKSEAELRSHIERYVSGDDEELQVADMQQMLLIVHQFKKMLIEARSSQVQPPSAVGSGSSTQQATPESNNSDSNLSSGPVESKIDSTIPAVEEEEKTRDHLESKDEHSPHSNTVDIRTSEESSAEMKSESDMFAEWKRKEGAVLNEQYSDLGNKFKELRTQFRSVSFKVNSIKREIDALSKNLQGLRAGKSPIKPDSDSEKIVIDEDEFEILCEMKQSKARYMAAFADWERIKVDSADIKERMRKVQTQMANEFLQWSEQKRSADDLDDTELLDKLETEKILSQDPDSLPYYNARKALLRNSAKKRSMRRTTTIQ